MWVSYIGGGRPMRMMRKGGRVTEGPKKGNIQRRKQLSWKVLKRMTGAGGPNEE
jgi:hypothetical protein